LGCQYCGAKIIIKDGTFLGFTKLRVPVLTAVCTKGHKLQIQLQVINNMRMIKAESFPPKHGEWFKNKTLFLGCPICLKLISIGDTHLIDNKGKVTPSIICPHGCGWHTFITLDGYEITESEK